MNRNFEDALKAAQDSTPEGDFLGITFPIYREHAVHLRVFFRNIPSNPVKQPIEIALESQIPLTSVLSNHEKPLLIANASF